MKKGQLIGIAIAGVCGVGAFIGMQKLTTKPQVVQREVRTNIAEVLVARSDMGLGAIASESSFRCQGWPQEAVPQGAVICRGAATMKELVGYIARAPILAHEPITRSKLIKPGEGGVLASILPEGRRAISTKITEDTGVGRLILPNDHVDVYLIRRVRGNRSGEEHTSELLFSNVRVLAIGQRLETKEGQKGVEGNTATLELSPMQSEKLALAKSMGDITLALRSIADFRRDGDGAEDGVRRQSETVRILRYGQKSRVSVGMQ
jgi:pilus assembly protein CpaB